MNLSKRQPLLFAQRHHQLSLVGWNIHLEIYWWIGNDSVQYSADSEQVRSKTYYFSTHGALTLALLVDSVPDDVLGFAKPPPTLPVLRKACIFLNIQFYSIELNQNAIWTGVNNVYESFGGICVVLPLNLTLQSIYWQRRYYRAIWKCVEIQMFNIWIWYFSENTL